MREEISIGTYIVKFRDCIRNAFADVDANSDKRKIPRRARFLKVSYCLNIFKAHLKLVPSSSR